MWQDVVLSVVSWIFALSLLPTVFHKTHKPAFSTGVLTTTGLYVIATVYITLHLWIAAFGAATVATVWGTITIQRWRLNRQEKNEPSVS